LLQVISAYINKNEIWSLPNYKLC